MDIFSECVELYLHSPRLLSVVFCYGTNLNILHERHVIRVGDVFEKQINEFCNNLLWSFNKLSLFITFWVPVLGIVEIPWLKGTHYFASSSKAKNMWIFTSAHVLYFVTYIRHRKHVLHHNETKGGLDTVRLFVD